MFKKSAMWIIGMDEAGRGPLAGPVTVAGIKVPATISNFYPAVSGIVFKKAGKIKDSKKLTPKKRGEWFEILTTHPKIEWAAAKVWPKTIDRINIAQAANLGVRRVYAKLARPKLRFGEEKLGLDGAFAFLDGGLKLPKSIPHKVVIKGDERIPVIAAASIIAKVIRDRAMLKLHKKYPKYGFDKHKGYGTKMHRQVIKKIGPCEVHRKSFKL